MILGYSQKLFCKLIFRWSSPGCVPPLAQLGYGLVLCDPAQDRVSIKSMFMRLSTDGVAIDPKVVMFFPTDNIVPDVDSSTSDGVIEVSMCLWLTEWILKIQKAWSCTNSTHCPSSADWVNALLVRRPRQNAGIRETMWKLSALYLTLLLWRYLWS